MATSPDKLRFLRAVPDPIPWYLRVGYNDHRLVENKLSAGDTRIFGGSGADALSLKFE
jgi:hypothetical protein